MKLCCTSYSYREPLKSGTMKVEDFITVAYEIGLDGVELVSYFFPTFERTYLSKIKRLALNHGMDIVVFGVSTNFCHPDPQKRKEEIKRVRKWLEIAEFLGAPALRIFAGHVPEGYSEEDAFQWVVTSLKEAVKYAENMGIVLAMENHGGITSTADNVIRIIEEVGSEWLRALLDTGNYRENVYENIAKTAPYAIHVHAKFYEVTEDGREKNLDYNRIVSILRDAGFKGYLSIEYEGKEDPKVAVPRIAKFLRELLKK
ncbi:MAG: sugar phosphate isomerase/epimerase [Thermoprotei archaeon]|mgnify:CR=1 FL=1|nr:MAG: sugar phosphate isomerase/epimerase [Thermoprotei archaeon]